tara:strand:+ start:140 stop:403 length:264 start_codon:yes stop_codon:yes gene_type:complete
MKTATKPTVTFTNYKGEWMIKSDVKLTIDNTSDSEFETIGGAKILALGSVDVTLKSGLTKSVLIGEYEKCFKNNDGTESHIYSTRNF